MGKAVSATVLIGASDFFRQAGKVRRFENHRSGNLIGGEQKVNGDRPHGLGSTNRYEAEKAHLGHILVEFPTHLRDDVKTRDHPGEAR